MNRTDSIKRQKQIARDFVNRSLKIGAIQTFGYKKVTFDMGFFNNGSDLAELGLFYVKKIVEVGMTFDFVLGMKCKGACIATAVTIALSQHRETAGRNVNFCIIQPNTSGVWGIINGATLQKGSRVLIVDDAITDHHGRQWHAVDLIRESDAKPVGVLTGFDYCNMDEDTGEMETRRFEIESGIPVFSLASADDLME